MLVDALHELSVVEQTYWNRDRRLEKDILCDTLLFLQTCTVSVKCMQFYCCMDPCYANLLLKNDAVLNKF